MSYKINIEKASVKNSFYRKVLFTTKQLQLVLMSLKPNEEIGLERHSKTTQFIRVEQGHGIAYVNNKRILLKAGTALVIPQKTWHNIINTGKRSMKLYTIYSPPEHPKKLVEKNKI